MKAWIRGGLSLLLGAGVGAIIATVVGLTAMVLSPRIWWVFGVGSVLAIGCLAAGTLVGLRAALPARVTSTAPNAARHTHPEPRRRGLLVALGVAGVLVGFASSMVVVLGGMDRTLAVVADLPDRISGEVHGTWDSRLLEQDIADMQASLDDRPLQNLYFFDTHYAVDAYPVTGERGVDGYTFRNGDLSLSSQHSGWSTDASFTIADVNPDVIRHIAETIYADDPDADIALMFVSSQYGFTFRVSINGTYESTSREFDARTGEELTER